MNTKIQQDKTHTGHTALHRSIAVLLSFLLFLLPISTQADDQGLSIEDRTTSVMTRNVYHGVDAEIFAIPTATDFVDLLTKVAFLYNGYHARNFPERAEALADEIAETQPALIGLQEAVLVRTGTLFDPASATTVQLDYVQLLMDALANRGLNYKVVVSVNGFDAELPSALGFDVRHTDREVILARTDLNVSELKLSNAQAENFATNCAIPSALTGAIVINRGWVSIDAKIRGKSFRMISTHLDGDCLPFTPYFQEAQANEILAGPANTELPVLLIGDFNSKTDGTGTTYLNLLAAGFEDAWNVTGQGAGYTCCQADDILNIDSILNQRIDLIMYKGEFEIIDIKSVGDNTEKRTNSGLWPSDHAGVFANIKTPSD